MYGNPNLREALGKAQEQIETRVIDEPDPWGPLHKYVPKEWWDGFMFMGTMYHHYWGKIWNYKHGITRKYLYMDEKGSFYSYRPDPISRESVLTKLYNKEEAFNQVFAGIEGMGATRETAYTEEYKRKRDEALVRAGYTVAGVSPEGIKEKHRWGEVEYKGNPGPKALPVVTYRGKRYYVDRRLNELRNVEVPWDIMRPIPEQELSGSNPGNPTRVVTVCFHCGSPIVYKDGQRYCPTCGQYRARWQTKGQYTKALSNPGNPGKEMASHRYYIVTQGRVPEGHATNDYNEAMKILNEARKTDPKAWLCDNVAFGTWNPTYIGKETITPKYETRYAKGIAINIPVSLGISKEQEELERFKYEIIMKEYQNKQNWKLAPTPFETTNPQDAQLVARAFTFYLGGAEIIQVDNKLTVTSKGYYHYVGG